MFPPKAIRPPKPGHARARTVAAIRHTATGRALTGTWGADAAARYLTNTAPYLDYPTALASGWPIATGVI